jgi:hypothetical protein
MGAFDIDGIGYIREGNARVRQNKQRYEYQSTQVFHL